MGKMMGIVWVLLTVAVLAVPPFLPEDVRRNHR